MCGGLAGVAYLIPQSAAWSSQAPIPGALSPDDQALAFRKFAYATGREPGFWWLQGRRYGLVDNLPTPLWDMHIGLVFRTRDLPGGGWEVRSIAQSFYTDVDNGTFLRTFRNPYTGEDIEIFYFPPAAASDRYRGLKVEPKTPAPGLKITDTVGGARFDGGVLTIRSDHCVSGVFSGKPIRVNDLSTYVGAIGDFHDSTVTMAPASQTFNDFNSWPDWFRMGDRPGTYMSRAYGRKAFAFADMPAIWRRLLKEAHPDLAEDPVGALGA